MRRTILARSLKRAAARNAPNRIPMSAPSVRERDYYSVALTARDESWSFLLTGFEHGYPRGLWLDGDAYVGDCCLLWPDLRSVQTDFRYYLDRFEFRSSNALAFDLGTSLGIFRLFVWLSKIQQHLYNRKSLVTRDRIDLLRHVVDATVDGTHMNFTAVSLMTHYYGAKWVFHPQKTNRLAYYRLLLDCLKDDGLVLADGHQYRLAPRGLTALNEFEDEERRHRDNRGLQRAIVALTVFSAIAAGFQAWAAMQQSQQTPTTQRR